MSASAFTAALLLASAPVDAGELPSPVPMLLVAQTSAQEQAPATPADTPSPTIITAPATENGADTSTAPSLHEDDDIIVSGRRATPGDPLQALNVQSYEAVQVVDKTAIAPLARGYEKAFPRPIRDGVRNFFNNLAEPVVFLNYLIQLKPGKAAETLGRFGLNSTIGVAGLVDVAKRKPFHLPLRRNGFANSMGYYGIKTGPFLFLPLVGPTTVRDLIGLTLDKLVVPAAVGKPFNQLYYTLPASAVSSLDYRVEFSEQLREQSESADPYAASRENYLRSREAEIEALHGRHSKDATPAPTGTGPLIKPALPPAPNVPEAAIPAPDAPALDTAPPPETPHD